VLDKQHNRFADWEKGCGEPATAGFVLLAAVSTASIRPSELINGSSRVTADCCPLTADRSGFTWLLQIFQPLHHLGRFNLVFGGQLV
jgi:hypothetical protein